ncbi:MAG: hypothetical protein UH103_01330 [Paludibacteraceae bacterium]|nr:hypothetical protein [Paludibacteraceae bacterium]
MLKRHFISFLLLIAIIEMYAQVREVVYHNGDYYSQATLMVDTLYNTSYEKDTFMVVVPREEGIVYPSNEAMGQFVTWMQGHPVYATPIVQYDSVAHRRNIAGDTLRIIFSNSTDALSQYEKEPIVWQHRQVTISDSAQLLSAEQYRAIAQGGDTSQFIIEPTVIYTDTLYVRNIVDTIYKAQYPYVDLGLSVKWATCNIGAESPEEYGDYFAWGETEPKETYSWATYKWSKGSSSSITKYNANDGKTVLDPEDDAATVILGENYRMPTVEEGNELIEQCTWSWTTYNNVAGYKVTGPNGNYIFLPAVGYKGSTNPYYPVGEYGLYWVANIYQSSSSRLLLLKSNVLPTSVGKQGTRCYGFAIRPVYVK